MPEPSIGMDNNAAGIERYGVPDPKSLDRSRGGQEELTSHDYTRTSQEDEEESQEEVF